MHFSHVIGFCHKSSLFKLHNIWYFVICTFSYHSCSIPQYVWPNLDQLRTFAAKENDPALADVLYIDDSYWQAEKQVLCKSEKKKPHLFTESEIERTVLLRELGSYFICFGERNTLRRWVRNVDGRGRWGDKHQLTFM